MLVVIASAPVIMSSASRFRVLGLAFKVHGCVLYCLRAVEA